MTPESIYGQIKHIENFKSGKYYIVKPSKKVNDAQLWSDFQSGSEDAYAKMYRDHVQGLYNYGIKIVKNNALVKDSIQDLFIEIWNRRSRLSQVESIKSYLFKSLRRKILADKSRQKKVISFDYYCNLENLSTQSTERKLIEKQEFDSRTQKLKKVIDLLTPKQKEAIYLKFYSHLSYAEISDVLGLSIKGTYKLVGRAIHILRKNWVDQ